MTGIGFPLLLLVLVCLLAAWTYTGIRRRTTTATVAAIRGRCVTDICLTFASVWLSWRIYATRPASSRSEGNHRSEKVTFSAR